uniref:Spermatogenesis-associated protein 6 N-terminal domain-containing protein n=1 Tax=Varanus komodoensis TaxID=61221 RepID=A0A8D2L7A7_VARKO
SSKVKTFQHRRSMLVTCPGAVKKNDVYLHVCILGQCKETDCLPPIFPLLFRERMWFEKVTRILEKSLPWFFLNIGTVLQA